MQLVALLTIAAFAALAAGVQSPHRKFPARAKRRSYTPPVHDRGHHNPPRHLNAKTEKFAVDGTNIPEVDFDVGESYAGTLSVTSNATDENRLFFWLFPSENPAAGDEIVIWLNGGPGCSSLTGLLQENGPFLWQIGTYKPVRNSYSWTNLTNMVYVDQPIGTGFSTAAKGAPEKIVSEKEIAEHLMGFWKNFIDTFDFEGRKVYLAGESYAGQYIPYMAQYMLEAKDKKYFNVKGILMYDPSIGEDEVATYAPSVWHLNDYSKIFGLNETFMKDVNHRAETCGYNDFMEQALTFPPSTPFPTAPNISAPGCAIWDDIVFASLHVNPCFNIYHLMAYCPFLWDELGFPGLGFSPEVYFNRTDVQKAINAPPTNFVICGDPSLGFYVSGDQSPVSSVSALPYVIEQTNNVIIGHGLLDYVLLANGSLATIQNMTWNGKQGFQEAPSDDFYVPYHPGIDFLIYEATYQPIPAVPITNVAGSGYLGKTHTERGLTFVTVDLAGHEVPQYAPGAAFRQLELLLGRIDSLTQVGPFTTQMDNSTARLL